MKPHVRPSPSPIALCARPEPRADLLALKRQLCDRPLDATELHCSVHAADENHPARVVIGYGPRRLGVPIIGSWPLDDLSPLGIVELVREIVDGMVVDHDQVVRHHAGVAVATCLAMGTLPGFVEARPDGSTQVEVCLEDDGRPIFWVERDGSGHSARRLDVDLDVMRRFAGPMPIPCHIYGTEQGGRSFDVIGFSMSDEEGLEIHAPSLDAMQTLRLHRLVNEAMEEAAAVALGEEA